MRDLIQRLKSQAAVIFCTTVLLMSTQAHAGSALTQAVAPFFTQGERSFTPQAALGPVCSSMRTLRSEVPCNPALLGEEDPEGSPLPLLGTFGFNFFVGEDYDTIYKNRDLISSNDKRALAEKILSETKPIRFESSVMLWWRGETTALSYQPRRWTYFSDVRNQAYPDAVVHGMQEQSLQGQVGGFLTENWRAGVRIRGIDRKYVQEQFNVFEALPDIDNHFQVKTQRALFIEPGLAYEVNERGGDFEWKPMFTLHLSQLGWIQNPNDEIPQHPFLDSGFSLSPPVAYGEWDVGLNYRWTAETSTERKIRLGTLYRLSLVELQAGVDPDEWSLGAFARLRALGVGILHKQTQTEDVRGGRSVQDSTFLEVRMTL